MQTDDVTVRLKALDGTWETAGRDRFPQVVPESLEYTFNEWGPDTCTYVLRRQAGDLHPDLSSFTETEVEIGGVKVWDGRVKETPTKEGAEAQITVNAEGWQYHLDDDAYERSFVHNRISDYKDARGLLPTDLTLHTAQGQVAVDGAITFTFPNGQAVPAGKAIAVTLDLGGPWGRQASLSITSSNNFGGGTTSLYGIATDTESWTAPVTGAGREDFFTAVLLTSIGAGPTTVGGTVSRGYRYVTFLMWTGGGAGVLAADVWAKIISVSVFADTSYASGGSSVLKASTPIRDAIDVLTPKLTRSGVQDTSFNIPHFAMEGAHTVREIITAANAYHDYLSYVSVHRDVAFKPKPSSGSLLAGPAAIFEDASANSGEDIYNKVIVEGQGPDNQMKRITRYQADDPNTWSQPLNLGFTNPGFEVDTSGWTYSGTGSLVRTTTVGEVYAGAGSAKFTGGGAGGGSWGPSISALVGGPFIAGQLYVFQFALSRTTGTAHPTPIRIMLQDQVSGETPLLQHLPLLGAGYQVYKAFWIPTKTTAASNKFFLSLYDINNTVFADDLRVFIARPTLIDRHRFMRTKILQVQASLTTTTATQIGDVYLQGHRTTPMKGTLKVPSVQGLIKTTGETVPAAEAGLYIGELVRFGHIVDPDSGALGRDGRIAGMGYKHRERAAEVQIDNRRNNFEAFLERLAVVTGPVS